jgi:hypothetical protein
MASFWASLAISFCLIFSTIKPAIAFTPKQQQVWDALIRQGSSIHNELYPLVLRDAQKDPKFASVAYVHRSLIFDRGGFRQLSDTDSTLEPNGYMLLVYELNFETRQWCLKAYEGPNSVGTPLKSYCQSIK